ncbi:MAG: phosphoenolpyruvate carboxykinase (ATP) [Robiginitomaculum sp.]|nr:phosphoenolpyruvate carboxykinase (ATP) [Robiginitomaculum sp.]
MKHTGLHINTAALSALGIENKQDVHWNWPNAALYDEAIGRHEGQVAQGGPLVVKTGQHTGRSAKDKYIVRDAETENSVWWEQNVSMAPSQFDVLWDDFKAYMGEQELFVQALFGGADLDHRLPVNVITEFAWHSLFIRHLLRIPAETELENFAAEFTIISMPGFRADPIRHGTRSETVIAVNMTKRLVLIGGTSYAGEIKKSVFSILNYLLPKKIHHAHALLGQCGP